MKIDRIIGALFFFVLLHLSFYVAYASVIQRSLADDIKSGISIAGKIFGFDSPSNIAAVSNIADLVSRAFSNTNSQNNNNGFKQYRWNDKESFDRRPTEKLETFDEVPSAQQSAHSNEEDNVIVGSSYNGGSDATNVDHGFLGQILRVLGMDTSKIGAMAINGIIFIAQMICRSLTSAFTNMTGTKQPTGNIDIAGSRQSPEHPRPEQARVLPIVDNLFEWISTQAKTNSFLSKQMELITDKELPEHIINYIDEGNDDDHTKHTDCIKLLICKITPIIRGMQKSVLTQINGEESETELDLNDDEMENKSTDYSMDAFSKHLPSVDEFRKYGGACERRFPTCKVL